MSPMPKSPKANPPPSAPVLGSPSHSVNETKSTALSESVSSISEEIKESYVINPKFAFS